MGRSRLIAPVVVAVVTLAAACTMPPPGGGGGTGPTTTTSTTTTTAPPQDVDGDGFNTLSDCDDSDPSINPGAADPAGDEIDAEERALMDRALTENSVIVAQMTPFFD